MDGSLRSDCIVRSEADSLGTQASRGNQGPHLERLSEHLKKLQDDLQSCSVSRHPSITGQGTQVSCVLGPSMTCKLIRTLS